MIFIVKDYYSVQTSWSIQISMKFHNLKYLRYTFFLNGDLPTTAEIPSWLELILAIYLLRHPLQAQRNSFKFGWDQKFGWNQIWLGQTLKFGVLTFGKKF